MSDPDQRRPVSWWSTIPGTITAVATLITAVGGLIIILQTTGVLSKKKEAETGVVAESGGQGVSTTTQAPAVHLDSRLMIAYPYAYDLDAGLSHNSESNADVDFTWEHPTSMDYELRPDLGKFVLLGKTDFDQVTPGELQKLNYSKNSISADLLMKGVVVGVLTKEKRFGKFIVEEGGLEPRIRMVVYAREE